MGACRQWPCLVESDLNLAAPLRQSTRQSTGEAIRPSTGDLPGHRLVDEAGVYAGPGTAGLFVS